MRLLDGGSYRMGWGAHEFHLDLCPSYLDLSHVPNALGACVEYGRRFRPLSQKIPKAWRGAEGLGGGGNYRG